MTDRGDTPSTGPPKLVDAPEPSRPTAGERRAAGYQVDNDVPDDAPPRKYSADTPTAPGQVILPWETKDEISGYSPLQRLGMGADAVVAAAPVPRKTRST